MNTSSDSIYKEKEVIVRTERVVPREFVILSRVIYYITDVIEVLLGFRFLLKALGANATGFSLLIYRISQPLVYPFFGIFPATGGSGVVLEWASLLAMAVYAFFAMLLVRLFRILLVR